MIIDKFLKKARKDIKKNGYVRNLSENLMFYELLDNLKHTKQDDIQELILGEPRTCSTDYGDDTMTFIEDIEVEKVIKRKIKPGEATLLDELERAVELIGKKSIKVRKKYIKFEEKHKRLEESRKRLAQAIKAIRDR